MPAYLLPDQTINIVIPKALEADAEVLLEHWRRNYAARQCAGALYPNLAMPASDASLLSDAAINNRLGHLPTVIPMELNAPVKKSINLFIKKRRKLIPTMLALGDYYFPVIETIFDKYGIPPELKYLAIVESQLNPTVVSPAGARGIWQFMVPTAKAYGLEINSLVDERMDLEKSTDAAARHLLDLYDVYKDWLVVIAAYNAGVGNVNKAIRRSGGKTNFWDLYKYLPTQTRDYIPMFIATYYAMHYHDDYHLQRANFTYPADIDTIHIQVKIPISKLVNYAGVSENFFRLINPQFKAGYVPGNIRPYAITLPLAAISKLEKKLNEESVMPLKGSGGVATNKIPVVPPSSSNNTSPSRSYTIRKGDSLYKIARKHGVSLKALMKANDIKGGTHKLIPGKVLQIP